MRGMTAGVIGAGLLVATAASVAQAAPPPFCRGYASAALNQVRVALAIPRCRGGMEGARWSADFRVHYDWCLGASPAAAAEEREARTIHIRRCRGF
jgi:hypothetical protein